MLLYGRNQNNIMKQFIFQLKKNSKKRKRKKRHVLLEVVSAKIIPLSQLLQICKPCLPLLDYPITYTIFLFLDVLIDAFDMWEKNLSKCNLH